MCEQELNKRYYDFAKENEDEIKKIFKEEARCLYLCSGQESYIAIDLDAKEIRTVWISEGNEWSWNDCEYRVVGNLKSRDMEYFREEVTREIVEDRNLSTEDGYLDYDELPEDIQKEIDDYVLNEKVEEEFQNQLYDFYKSCGE